MKQYFCGIDSGLDGGIVVTNSNRDILLKKVMPTLKNGKKRVIDFDTLFCILKNVHEKTKGHVNFVIEKTHARPGKTNTSQFSLGRSLGQLEGVTRAFDAKVIWLTPGKWMKHLKDYSVLQDPTLRQFETARIVWPDVDLRASQRCIKPHSGIVAAALISIVGKKVLNNE